jgi:galactokinase/mevalonate kinase-like predicted kinase
VIGEAEGRAVTPDEFPAMAKSGRPVRQMGGEIWGNGAHGFLIVIGEHDTHHVMAGHPRLKDTQPSS